MKVNIPLALLLAGVIIFSSCSDTIENESTSTDETVTTDDSTESLEDALNDNSTNHEADADYAWIESDVITVTLSGNTISVDPAVATISGSTVTLTQTGTYRIIGTLDNGQVIVNNTDDELIRLLLHNASITNSTSAPLYIQDANKAIIYLEEGTENSLADGVNYTFANADEDEPNATLFSKTDLTIFGEGSLSVKGNYNDGISSKDGLILKSGNFSVTAKDDGIRGKDYLYVKSGTYTILASGDGLKSDNDEDTAKGFISIEDGTFNISAGADGLQAETDLLIADGNFTITSGGGSAASVASEESAKALKGGVNVIVEAGTFSVNAADDAVHSNINTVINGGVFTIATGDDGLHADATLTINGGDITITKSYEGLESAVITINDGTIHATSSDDGINVAGGADNSGSTGPTPPSYSSSGDYYLYIHGGYVYVDANGDGLDANGSIEMTNGTVVVNGPTASNNAPLDYDGTFKISGGTLVAAGSSGMAQQPGSTSTQNSVLITFSTTYASGNLVRIQTSSGEDVVTFKPSKKYQSLVFSGASLKQGSTYQVYSGGSSTGSGTDGLYQDGTYTGGSLVTSFTISGITTKVAGK